VLNYDLNSFKVVKLASEARSTALLAHPEDAWGGVAGAEPRGTDSGFVI
jgi:hypothetical protein